MQLRGHALFFSWPGPETRQEKTLLWEEGEEERVLICLAPLLWQRWLAAYHTFVPPSGTTQTLDLSGTA